ncbi:nitrate reductase cytochrome c-type subunit [Helicobacter jaachi]|uniref:Periplasmic nitrate reductase, electron transfer subunit n=1 Tax=Helicobacter jaachi TaxID=1677920 RepID=A0A4U8TC57_9HELI|nr:nitrate reductase cytochrome c-type subunit [Helicobacter jaachi]TLD97521.1 nitrate reductase cytochrome c-type subunit [Helicobacter jaachi]
MKKYARGLMIGLLGLALFACSDSKSAKEEVADTDIGIRKVDLEDEKDVKLLQYEYPTASAGESTRIERSYENAPPMIPHNIDDMLPITADNNQCLACHDPAIAADIGAIPVPASHTYDLRTDKKLNEVAHARFNCVLCHTPQANVAPAIANTFSPTFRTQDGKSASNLLDVLNEGVK